MEWIGECVGVMFAFLAKDMEKGDVMTFEQPAELNRYLYPQPESGAPSPFWPLVKILNPLVAISCLLLVEVRWLKGLPVLEGLVIALLMYPALLLLVWYSSRKEGRFKLTLSIHDDGLSCSRTPVRRIRWKRIRCFRVEPCGPQGEFEKFTVRYASPGVPRLRSWSMIFADATGRTVLLSELEKRRTGDDRKWKVEILKAPAKSCGKIRSAPFWLYMLSILFLAHGLPFLFVGITPAEAPSRATPEGSSPPVRALVKWFASSGVDPREFLTLTGAALTAIGAGSFWIAETLLRRQTKIEDAEEAEDVRKKLVAAGGQVEIK